MLGLFRYILAFMVCFSHLWDELMWWQGIYAVFCFYLISGYLMSKILNEVYINKFGSVRYLGNRLLRIYPLYLVVLAMTVVVVNAFPNLVDTSFALLVFSPQESLDWLRNITLLYPVKGKLAVTQAWSLQVELVFYFAMICLVRNSKVVVGWFLLSVVFVLYLNHTDAIFLQRYATVLGASIAFSLGSIIYQLRKKIQLGNIHLLIAPVLYALNLWFAPEIWGFSRSMDGLGFLFVPEYFGLYSSLIFGGYVLLAIISNEKKTSLNAIGSKLGNLAYSVFLTHWLVAYFLVGMGISFEEKIYLLPIGFALINILSVLLYCLVERPINRGIRKNIRGVEFKDTISPP